MPATPFVPPPAAATGTSGALGASAVPFAWAFIGNEILFGSSGIFSNTPIKTNYTRIGYGSWQKHPTAFTDLNPNIDGATFYSGSGGLIRDSAGGTITGTANKYIYEIPWIFKWFGYLECEEPSANFTSSGFGSFTQAATDLNALVSTTPTGDWELVYRVLAPETLEDMASRLMSNCPMLSIFRSMVDGKWKMIVYSSTPAADTYFKPDGTNNHSWRYGEDMFNVKIGLTSVENIVNEVHVNYGMFAPTAQFTKDCFVSPGNSDNGAGTRDQNAAAPDNRETICDNSRDRYRIKNAVAFQYDQIINDEQAKVCRNHIVDRHSSPRPVISFETHDIAATLEPCMTTLVDDVLQTATGLHPPSYPGATNGKLWSDWKWFVRDVSFSYSKEQDVYSVSLEGIV